MIGFLKKHNKLCHCRIKIWFKRWNFCLFCGGVYKCMVDKEELIYYQDANVIDQSRGAYRVWRLGHGFTNPIFTGAPGMYSDKRIKHNS